MIIGAFVVLCEGSDTIESPPIALDGVDSIFVTVVIGSLLIINWIILNECVISSIKDVFELFNASMHPFKTSAICK